MKKILSTSVIALAVLAGTNVMAEGHTPAVGTGNARATLETGIVVEEQDEMNFGTITRLGDNPAGTITLSQEGTRTSSSESLEVTQGTAAAGVIKISGAANTAVDSITYGKATLSNGSGKTIELQAAGPATADLTTGEATVKVGGTLTLDGTEPDGEYSTKSDGGEPYNVTVAY